MSIDRETFEFLDGIYGLIPEQIIKNDGKWCFECCLIMFEMALTWVIAFLLKAELLHGEYADIYTCVSIITHVPTHAWEGEINLYGSVR